MTVTLSICPTLAENNNIKISEGDYVQFGGYTWQVIHVEDNTAMLFFFGLYFGEYDASIHGTTVAQSLTRYNTFGSVTWEYSDVRQWLNSRGNTVNYNDVEFDYDESGIVSLDWDDDALPSYASLAGFLNANHFSDAEFQIMIPVTHKSLIPYPESKMQGVFATAFGDFTSEEIAEFYQGDYGVSVCTDYMFLLSGIEFKEYVLDQGLTAWSFPSGSSYNRFWLRDSVIENFAGYYLYYGTYALTADHGRASCDQADDRSVGIRPACCIDLNKIIGLEGDGSIENPYVFSIKAGIIPHPETAVTLPDAVRYLPYTYDTKSSEGTIYALEQGVLPSGLSVNLDGEITGASKELGVFYFTVSETTTEGKTYHSYTLSSIYQGAVDVEQYNPDGYGFVETETDNGHVDSQDVNSVEELTEQTAHMEGAYTEFRNLYLDAQKLTRDVDYTVEEGSTVITVLEDTLARAGGGTHMLSAKFRRVSGKTAETVYTVQTFTISGAPGTTINLSVHEKPIVWWDAEPYIDGNNRTMCPFRIIGEALGLTAGWDGEKREAYFTDGSRTIYFPIDGKTARTSEGGTVQMDTAAVIVNGRTYAPVRYLAEYFGYSVGWDGASRTVSLN